MKIFHLEMKLKVTYITYATMLSMVIILPVGGETAVRINAENKVLIHFHSIQNTMESTLNTKPKKQFRAKRKIAGLWDCHPFLQYKSNLQTKREKAIRKNRRKL
jgi:hypothetical protein